MAIDAIAAKVITGVGISPTGSAPAAESAEGGATVVEHSVQFELGRAALSVDDAMALKDGAVVALDKRADDPLDVVVDGRLHARGEALVLNGKLCVRVVEIIARHV